MSGAHRHGSDECREIAARLSEYLDQELDRSLCDELEGHMGDCPPCQAFLASLRATVELLREAPPARLPAEVRRAILDEFERLRGTRGAPGT